ncbi:MAG: Ig-like domain-containing protein [Terracidiphilus sp.]
MQARRMSAAVALLALCSVAVPALAATHDVTKKPTTTTLTGSTHSIVQGQTGTLTVKVAPKPTLGVVTLYYTKAGGKRTQYGTESLSSSGVAVFHKIAGAPGKYVIQAVYSGSSTFASSTSNGWAVTVLPK